VKPISDNISPKAGSVVVYRKDNLFVVHRIVEIIKDHGGILQIITRGDSQSCNDAPVLPGQLLGVAVTFRRKGKGRKVRNAPVTHFGYMLNRLLFSWHFRVRQIHARFTGNRKSMRASDTCNIYD
jgi:hypothetical protein